MPYQGLFYMNIYDGSQHNAWKKNWAEPTEYNHPQFADSPIHIETERKPEGVRTEL